MKQVKIHFKQLNIFCKIRIFSLFLLFAIVPSNQGYSQEIDSIISHIDSLKLKSLSSIERDSIDELLKKITHFLKFRKNRDTKEKEQIHNYLDSLIVNGELRVDSLNLNLIIDQINEAFHRDSIVINEIKQNIDASRIDVDSLAVKINFLVEELSNKNLLQKKRLNDTIETSLKEIKTALYSMGNIENASLDSLFVKNEKKYFKKHLKTKKGIQVIGWHNSWNDIEYKNYNYNYLSSINLFGFSLGTNGESKNEVEIIEFQKEGGVIDYANKNGCDVSLTVYNRNAQEVSKFLSSEIAQSSFIERLQTLIFENSLNGINIFFEDVRTVDHLNFVKFMMGLSVELNKIDESIDLNLTIPSLYDDKSLVKSNAYNFIDLNEIVDYYIVLTDRMTSDNNKRPQSASPLYNDADNVKWSIESTINFYSNGKIPASKLIVSVSYSGLKWNVKDSWEEVVHVSAKDIKYRDIIRKFKRNKDIVANDIEGFDPVQVATYLDITDQQKNKYRIWYEDVRSMNQKYKWVQEIGIAGVSIRGLGYDDGYSELWDVLGKNLIEIDTLFLQEEGKTDLKNQIKDSELYKIDALRYFLLFGGLIILVIVYRKIKKK